MSMPKLRDFCANGIHAHNYMIASTFAERELASSYEHLLLKPVGHTNLCRHYPRSYCFIRGEIGHSHC